MKRNQNCLEPCVRLLVSCLESDGVMVSELLYSSFPNCSHDHQQHHARFLFLLFLQSDVQEDGTNPYVLTNPVTPALPAFPRVSNTYGSYQDSNIPFPRTSGARFCGTGGLQKQQTFSFFLFLFLIYNYFIM